MSKKEKLLAKAENNPTGLKMQEFTTLMTRVGWILDHQRGSHQIWYSPNGYRLSVQTDGSQAKRYQVKQFLQRYYEENNYE